MKEGGVMNCRTSTGLIACLLLAVSNAPGQDVLVVDQASGDLTEPVVNGSRIPENGVAQSFTPSLSAVGFVQLRPLVTLPGGSTVDVVVHLRGGSFDGPILGTTTRSTIVGSAPLETLYFPAHIPL